MSCQVRGNIKPAECSQFSCDRLILFWTRPINSSCILSLLLCCTINLALEGRGPSRTMSIHNIIQLGLCVSSSLAHSWVQRLMRIELNGTMVGPPGYIRSAASREEPGFTDFWMQHKIPPNGRKSGEIFASDRLCKPEQVKGKYSSKLPPLQAYAGDYIAIQYEENGHVTRLADHKPNSGYVYIYGTSDPRETDTLLSIHKQWNEHGTGGDRRGRLLAVRPFDDGRCYEINAESTSQYRQSAFLKAPLEPQNDRLWCQNDLKLPEDIVGDYSLYWVWDWPSRLGDQEIYTSCMDIRVSPKRGNGKLEVIKHQDLNFAAIEEQLLAGVRMNQA